MDYSLPIRIRWEVGAGPMAPPLLRIAAAIREAEPLSVDLMFSEFASARLLPLIVSELLKGVPQISATVRLSAESVASVSPGLPVAVAWEVRSAEDLTGLPTDASTVAFVPDRDTLPLLPDLLRAFASSSASTLLLPNINAVRAAAAGVGVPIPDPLQFEELRRALAASPAPIPVGRRIVIHDYFLWDLLRSIDAEAVGDRLEFSGCQAGTAVAYIDVDGAVYPCDAWPLRLGDLLVESMESVWEGPVRRNLVTAVATVPPICRTCLHLPGCHAGCRGLAFVVVGEESVPDPSCPGPDR